MSGNYPPILKSQVHEDLTIRARGGMFVYLAVWLVSTIWANVPASHPVFFYLNTLLISITLLLRLLHYRIVRKNPQYKIDLMSRALILLVLFSALHWGLLSAWILYSNEFPQLNYPYMIMLAAFAIGGTTTLSISREIRIFYPVLMFIPALLQGLLFDENSLFLMLSLLALLSYIYVLEASRVSSEDYYKAITNGKIAAERAHMLEKLSNTDPLTLLKNRLYFNSRFIEEWKRCGRLQIPLSIMMIDLDHFKNINDTYGHVYGDKCLQKVARTLQIQLPRVTDTIARYGGEEFVILLTNTELDMAEKIADKLVRRISDIKLLKDNQAIAVSCSIGVACSVPSHLVDHELLLIAADNAMYQAKQRGRNQWATAEVNV